MRQAKLGCAPAHKLFDLVKVTKKAAVEYPRSYRDYDAVVKLDKVPSGVQIGFKPDPFSRSSGRASRRRGLVLPWMTGSRSPFHAVTRRFLPAACRAGVCAPYSWGVE